MLRVALVFCPLSLEGEGLGEGEFAEKSFNLIAASIGVPNGIERLSMSISSHFMAVSRASASGYDVLCGAVLTANHLLSAASAS